MQELDRRVQADVPLCRPNLARGGSGRAVEEEEEEAQEEAAQILFTTRRSHLEIWTFAFETLFWHSLFGVFALPEEYLLWSAWFYSGHMFILQCCGFWNFH